MKEKTNPILISVLVGFVAFPTITLGGTFVSSLIQGKTVEEAVHILAEQIDSLIGRVEVLETKQAEQERLGACEFVENALSLAQAQGGIIIPGLTDFDELISKIIKQRDRQGAKDPNETLPEGHYQVWQSRLEKVQSLKERYFVAKAKCEEIDSD